MEAEGRQMRGNVGLGLTYMEAAGRPLHKGLTFGKWLPVLSSYLKSPRVSRTILFDLLLKTTSTEQLIYLFPRVRVETGFSAAIWLHLH